MGSGELSTVYETSRGAISGFEPNGPHELDLRISRMMLPSEALFFRGLPSLYSVSRVSLGDLWQKAYLIEGE